MAVGSIQIVKPLSSLEEKRNVKGYFHQALIRCQQWCYCPDIKHFCTTSYVRARAQTFEFTELTFHLLG